MRQYAETGLVAIDLVNTWDEYLDDPERLPDVASLHRFCQELACRPAALREPERSPETGTLTEGARKATAVDRAPTEDVREAAPVDVRDRALGEDAREAAPVDVRDPAPLADAWEAAPVEAGDMALTEGDLVAVREVRGRLRDVLAVADPGGRAAALGRWASELPVRALVETEGGVPRLRPAPPDGADLALRLAVRAVTELLDVAAAGDWDRLRLCAARPCRDAFIDRSRPGRRQFCSTRCANRAHAAASRARHR
uniref:CGNR zinc finger domain-containing protein n=1 Tax=Nonomuraea pusilla TaxID=46177 RepID=UPI0006E156F5|nr:CGNR zinc finger domain-containing protein [Nonomuraea pusilla]